jgi:hypothetical protein
MKYCSSETPHLSPLDGKYKMSLILQNKKKYMETEKLLQVMSFQPEVFEFFYPGRTVRWYTVHINGSKTLTTMLQGCHDISLFVAVFLVSFTLCLFPAVPVSSFRCHVNLVTSPLLSSRS